MRWTKFILTFVLTLGWLALLMFPLPPIPFSFGGFLNPFDGFWQNAESGNEGLPATLSFPALAAPVEVVVDERDVPHIFASSLEDAVYVQGYLTARDRLWQMDFQTRAAAGRLSELIGAGTENAVLDFDRQNRRKGLPWAAERSLAVIMDDPGTAGVFQAYSDGVNAWIEQMSRAEWPIEYKLLNYEPEPWSPYKSALFLKYMANMLAAGAEDIEDTYALKWLGRKYFDLLFPEYPYEQAPIIPPSVSFPQDSVVMAELPERAYAPDSFVTVTHGFTRTEEGVGSNNWAIAGEKSATGRPILANDPHLGLNLPAIWYEIQISTPEANTYGVSLPGAPGIIIGFNDSIAWGLTNASVDVMDFYVTKFKDDTEQEYLYDEQWLPVNTVIDTYQVKGLGMVLDTVRYTHVGPVMFDRRFGEAEYPLALRWTAHDPANEARTFLELMQAENYEDYESALTHYGCPAQNFVFASAAGDIAIWQQGRYPVRWPEQGRFLLDGSRRDHMWDEMIPQAQMPHVLNPSQGFVGSANQHPTSEDYPYYYTGYFDASRGRRLTEILSGMDTISVEDMKRIQQDSYSMYARDILPLLLEELDTTQFDYVEITRRAYRELQVWDYRYQADLIAPTIFQTWWDELYEHIWADEWEIQAGTPLPYPSWATTVRLLRDSAEFSFFRKMDDTTRYDRKHLINLSFDRAVSRLHQDYPNYQDWRWGQQQTTTLRHLARSITPFNRTGLVTDGVGHVLNANKGNHGPSWRMIVALGDEPQGYGVYPGGQRGNPGHPRYDQFAETWRSGEYFSLWRMKSADEDTRPVRYRLTAQPQ